MRKNGGVQSCVVPVRAVAGAEITTIEGVAEKRLLRNKRRPSDQAIEESMSGNICRCGTDQRIRARIKAAAMEVS